MPLAVLLATKSGGKCHQIWRSQDQFLDLVCSPLREGFSLHILSFVAATSASIVIV